MKTNKNKLIILLLLISMMNFFISKRAITKFNHNKAISVVEGS